MDWIGVKIRLGAEIERAGHNVKILPEGTGIQTGQFQYRFLQYQRVA